LKSARGERSIKTAYCRWLPVKLRLAFALAE